MRFKQFILETDKEWAKRNWTGEADAIQRDLEDNGHDPGGNVGKAFQLARDCFDAVAQPGTHQHTILHGDLNKTEVDYDKAEMEGDHEKMHAIIQGPLNAVRHIHKLINRRKSVN